MNPEQRVADAMRVVALHLEEALEDGRQSRQIDAEDLRETLLSIADQLDPPLAELVHPSAACPNCGERKVDLLVWQDDDSVRCSRCQATYEPSK